MIGEGEKQGNVCLAEGVCRCVRAIGEGDVGVCERLEKEITSERLEKEKTRRHALAERERAKRERVRRDTKEREREGGKWGGKSGKVNL